MPTVVFEEDRQVAAMSRKLCIRYDAIANTDTWALCLTHYAGAHSWNEGIWGSSDRSRNRESDRETEIRALHTRLLEKDKVITLLLGGYLKQSDCLSQMGFKLSAGEIVVDRSLPWRTEERARIAEEKREYVRSQIAAQTESSERFTTGSRTPPPREPREQPVLSSSQRRR
jgi:hypothetical protein